VAREPRWLPRLVLEATHLDQVREHGGLPGLRDEPALEAALARPRQKWHYHPRTSFAALVAAYGFGVTMNHPFRDGNKRAGFLAMVIFAGLNRYELVATDPEVVTLMVGLAAGHLDENGLAAWLRPRLIRSK
jgi:death-on-curing protein